MGRNVWIRRQSSSWFLLGSSLEESGIDLERESVEESGDLSLIFDWTGACWGSMAGGNIQDLKIDRSVDSGEVSRRWIWGVILLVMGIGGVGLFFVGKGAERLEVETYRVPQAAVGQVSETVLNATGYVTARRSATVSSKVTGKITEIFVEEGDAVERGMVVARLDPVNVEAFLKLAVSQLEARRAATDETAVLVREAELEADRVARLTEASIASQADFDQAQARLDSRRARLRRLQAEVAVAEKQVALSRQDLEDLAIRAPFSGVVISKDAQPGEVISPVSAGTGFTRTGLCTVVDMASLEIEVDVNESYINRVSPAQPVTALLDAYPDWRIGASVIAIVPAADRQKATVKVRIGFEKLDPRILPDMGVKVSFQSQGTPPGPPGERKAFVRIPKHCLLEIGEKTYAFLVSGGQLERRAVKVEPSPSDTVVVVTGLRGGEVLVVRPTSEHREGMMVEENAR